MLNSHSDGDAAAYPVTWTPTTFILDSDGGVLGKTVGGNLKNVREMMGSGLEAYHEEGK